ncbi:type II toxin-antitoxin system ParD family antitoxin [Sphingomonas sp. PsM26]|nr:type II toxin-antitoxin system ParD family antitoxin [Sphingomonas sp. PsM26]
MIARKSLNVTVTPELHGFIAAALDSGRYGNVSEVVRAALRLLEERETDFHRYRASRISPQIEGR